MQNPRPRTPTCIGSTTAVSMLPPMQVCYMPRRARGKDNEQR